eukprot:2702197-Rhodomonas_salina.2
MVAYGMRAALSGRWFAPAGQPQDSVGSADERRVERATVRDRLPERDVVGWSASAREEDGMEGGGEEEGEGV